MLSHSPKSHSLHWLIFLLLLSACNVVGASDTGFPIPGTGDAIRVLEALADAYNQSHPNAPTVMVPASVGSSGGIHAVIKSEAMLARTARPLKPKEEAQGLMSIPWATYPVVFYAHPEVNINRISTAQLEAIYTGRVRDWSVLGGSGKIRLIQREKGDSCRRRLEAELPALFPKHDAPPALTTVTTQTTMEAVNAYHGALAYGPYPELIHTPFRILSLDGIPPSDPAYPLRNTLYFVKKHNTDSPVIRDFLDFIGSEKGKRIIRSYGMAPIALPADPK